MTAQAHLRIATRGSRLALWQAAHVQEQLQQAHRGLTCELVIIKTTGDRILDTPLAKIGGKGLFIKELEVALEAGRADIAVHSMKDVPMTLPTGFAMAIVGARENICDALVSNRYATLAVQRAVVSTLRDRPLRILTLEDFVLFKVLSTRDRDTEDARSAKENESRS